jgi:DNA-binding transcriptional regulator YhcF (GntR family)
MSYTLTDAAFNQFNVNGAQQRILTGLCTFASNMGRCFPSVAAIAAKCKISTRTVERHLPELERKGIIERQKRLGRSSITRIHLVTPAKMAEQYRQNVGTESVTESVNSITAQPAAPVVAESPAVAAIVLFDSVKPEVRDTAPVVSVPVVDELVADLPIIDVVAHLPVVDVPTAVITVDLVADTAPAMPEPAIAPVVELVPAVQMPDAPVVATDTAPAMPDAATAQAPADTVAVGLVPAVDVPALPAANVPDAVAQVQALPTAPVVDNPLADCPPQALADFGLAREKKGRSATPTSTELSILGKQGAAVGLTISQVIMLCAGEGWAWFQSKWATPPVMERFRAEWMPGQAPVTSVQLVLVPESAPPASPDVINAAKANIARIKAEQIDRLAVQRYRL